MDNVIDFPSGRDELSNEAIWHVERSDGLAVQAMALASSYAAHREYSMTPEQVVAHATAYLAFLRNACMVTVQ